MSFYVTRRIRQPADVIPALVQGELHWRRGYAAYELARAWVGGGGIPPAVRAVLEQAPEYREAALIEAFFERETEFRPDGDPGQTDILALIKAAAGHAVMGIEGKLDETLGPLASERQAAAGDGGTARLDELCGALRLEPGKAAGLRWRLLEKTAALLREARTYHVENAVLLVHSFNSGGAWFDDFRAFAEAMGAACTAVHTISPAVQRDGIGLRLGWVADRPEA